MGRRFENFSGNYFKEQQDNMKAISEWSRSSNKPLSAFKFKNQVVSEQRASEDHENEKAVNKSVMPVTTKADFAAMVMIPDPNVSQTSGIDLDHED